MFCPNCGKPVSGSCCPECGTPLGTSIFLWPYIPASPEERKQLFRLVFGLGLLAPAIAILTVIVGGVLFFGLLWVLIRRHFFL